MQYLLNLVLTSLLIISMLATFFSPYFFQGHLYLNSSLDYESQHAFELTVQVSDDGTPSLSSTQTLTVLLMDVNDETPLFEQNLYKASVMENSEPGEAVITVRALDLDSGTVQEESDMMDGWMNGLDEWKGGKIAFPV